MRAIALTVFHTTNDQEQSAISTEKVSHLPTIVGK